MKNLEEVKEEVSFKYNFLSWDDLMGDVYSKAYEDPEKYYNEVSKRYALEAIKHDRERVSDFAANNQDLTKSELKQAIKNLPIELK